MGDPEDALFAAHGGARHGCRGVPVRLGINLGPVRLVKDINGQMNIIGDGINVAQRVMSFAEPGPAARVALLLRGGVVPVARLREALPARGLAHRQARARARGLLGGRRRAGARRVDADRVDGAGARRGLARRHRGRSGCAARRCSPRRSPCSSLIGGGVGARGPCSTRRIASAGAPKLRRAHAGGARAKPVPLPGQVDAEAADRAPSRRRPSVGRGASRRRPAPAKLGAGCELAVRPGEKCSSTEAAAA